MANNLIKRKWNQNTMVSIEDLSGSVFQAESGGHTFEISGVDNYGNTVALSGTVAAVFMRADNTDVAITGSASGGVVSVTLPAECYDVPGRFGLTVFVTADSKKTAVYAAIGTVRRTSSGNVAPSTTADVVDLINQINAAVATIPQSWSGLMADIAPNYSTSAVYPVGAYVYYNGDLYRCTTAITTAESWTAGHWTTAVLGQDVSELKSAINIVEYLPLEQGTISGANVNSPVTTRVRSKGFVFGKVTVTCNSGIKIARIIYCNPATGAYIETVEPNTQTYTLNGLYAARLVFKKDDGNATLTVNDVKINTVWEELFHDTNQLKLEALPMEQGGIDTAGLNVDVNTRIRNKGYIRGAYSIVCPDGVKVYRVAYYNESTFAFDSVVSIDQPTAKIYKSGCVSRVVFSKTNANNSIDISDISQFTASISQIIQDADNKAQNTIYAGTNNLFTLPGQLVRVTNGIGGFIVTEQTLITTNYIPVTPGEIITVRGRGSDGATALVCYYDQNYKPVSSVGGASLNDKATALTVPAGAYFIRVCKEVAKTGVVNCLATRCGRTFEYSKLGYSLHGYEMPIQDALPDELLATSESFVQADVPAFVYGLYDALVTLYPNYITKVNCNTETGIGTDTLYPIYMYKFVPPQCATSATSSASNETIKKIMIVSGAHNELASVYGLYLMMKYICENGNHDSIVSQLRYNYEIDVIPVVNPYGLTNGLSVDENGVDFERNFFTNDWQVTGTAGQKGYSGTAPLTENNTKIVDAYISGGGYVLFADCHNFYEAAGRALCWIVPPISPIFGDSLYGFGCAHAKSMTGLWKKQFSTTFPNDRYVYGMVTIPHENERGSTDYTGSPARGLSHYGIKAFTVESCETCSYINGEYDPEHYVRGTADVMTRVTENIINSVLSIVSV